MTIEDEAKDTIELVVAPLVNGPSGLRLGEHWQIMKPEPAGNKKIESFEVFKVCLSMC